MKKFILLIAIFCVFCMGVLHAQTPIKGLTVTGAYDTMKTVEPTPRFVSKTGELYKHPVVSVTGQVLTASIRIASSSINPKCVLSDVAKMDAYVTYSGDYILPVIERGVCYGTSSNPTVLGTKTVDANLSGNGHGSYIVTMEGLTPGTSYHARAYAVCVDDTVYGSDLQFTTLDRTSCTVTNAHTNTTDYTGSSTTPGNGGLETLKEGSTNQIITVTDQEGNIYPVVQIGGQCWLGMNLRTKHHSPNVSSNMTYGCSASNSVSCQKSMTDPYYYYPDGDVSNERLYGLLYNWSAASGNVAQSGNAIVQGICPDGWHLPSLAEFQAMRSNTNDCGDFPCYGSVLAGSYYGNDYPGHSTYQEIDTWSNYWSSSESNSSRVHRLYYHTEGGVMQAGNDTHEKNTGFSVRCVRDIDFNLSSTATNNKAYICGTTPVSVTYTATPGNGTDGYTFAWEEDGNYAAVDGNSYISTYNTPGTHTVTCTATGYGTSASKTITIEVLPGEPVFTHSENKKKVTLTNFYGESRPQNITWGDGASTNNIASNKTSVDHTYSSNGTYTITATNASGCTYTVDVTIDDYMHADMSCAVSSRNANESGYGNVVTGLKDYDGNNYAVVKIGNQCWMAQSLRVKHYPDGTVINQGNSGTTTTDKVWYYPPQGDSQVETYGLLYNWYAARGSNSGNPGVCPTGWHVPDDSEVSSLISSVNGKTNWRCDGNSGNVANALSGIEGWNNFGESDDCASGYNKPTINASGYTALPSGTYTGGYNDAGQAFYIWTRTATESEKARNYHLGDYYYYFSSDSHYKVYGFSIRCLRD